MKRWHWSIVFTAALISLLAGFAAPLDDDHGAWWNSIPVFFAVFGFFGCGAIIFFAKTLGKLFLRKKEDYYNVH